MFLTGFSLCCSVFGPVVRSIELAFYNAVNKSPYASAGPTQRPGSGSGTPAPDMFDDDLDLRAVTNVPGRCALQFSCMFASSHCFWDCCVWCILALAIHRIHGPLCRGTTYVCFGGYIWVVLWIFGSTEVLHVVRTQLIACG